MADLLESYAKSLERKTRAKQEHRDFLDGVARTVEPLWHAFVSAFGTLAERAQNADIEWNAPDPRDRGLIEQGWGRSGRLIGIRAHGDDLIFTTEESFRSEISESEATIPRRFLGADGMAVMQAEAAQLGAELDRRIEEAAEKDRQLQEEHDRSELRRLSAIYGGQPSKA